MKAKTNMTMLCDFYELTMANGYFKLGTGNQTAVFDMDINLILTRNQTKSKKQAGYKFMPTVQTFDYLPIGSKEDYPISFRIARFKIADDSYETVITNLDLFCFSAENLRNYIT